MAAWNSPPSRVSSAGWSTSRRIRSTRLPSPSQVGVGQPLAGLPDGQALQGGPDGVQLPHVLEVEAPDQHPPGRELLDQVLGEQHPQRLPQRGPAHPPAPPPARPRAAGPPAPGTGSGCARGARRRRAGPPRLAASPRRPAPRPSPPVGTLVCNCTRACPVSTGFSEQTHLGTGHGPRWSDEGKDDSDASSRVGPSAARRHGAGAGGDAPVATPAAGAAVAVARAGDRAGDPGRHGARRRVRPDGADRGQGHGGRQAGPQRPGPEPGRGRRHDRPAEAGQRQGQRRPHPADGAGRGRQRLHQQVRGHPGADHPAGPADRGARDRRGRQGLPLPELRPAAWRPGRPTRARSRSAAGRPRAVPTTWPRC